MTKIIMFICIAIALLIIIIFWIYKYYEFRKYKIKEFNKYALKNSVDIKNLLFYTILLKINISNKILNGNKINMLKNRIEEIQQNIVSEED